MRLVEADQSVVAAKRALKQSPATVSPASDAINGRIERIILTDGVAHTLFEDYTSHRHSARGNEEIGWDLLGYRHGREVIAMAALPAGMERDAGVAHVLFNRDVQELLSHILRQNDKRLGVVGVVHTHPGNLHVPATEISRGTGNGSANCAAAKGSSASARRTPTPNFPPDAPNPHQQYFGNLCFSWYALSQGDRQYRRLPVQVTLGCDLARPLLAVWDILETHAKALNRLYRQ